MCNRFEHPAVSRALCSGYGYDEEEAYESEQTFYYSSDVGEMDLSEAIAYMVDFCRKHPEEAAEMFGLETRTRIVPCDAYGELL
jgi:hypothetical protein